MESPGTYYGVLHKMIGNHAAINQEKIRLNEKIRRIGTKIKARLRPETVPGLLWHLEMQQLKRIAPIIGIPVSDFAGQARFLRALCAAVPFTSVQPAEDPKTADLLAMCDDLWRAMFFREMLDDLKSTESPTAARQRFLIASLTSLLNVVQGELTYVQQIEERVHRLFAPFSKEIIEPATGLSADDAVKGFREVRSIIKKRWEAVLKLSELMMKKWNDYQHRVDAGATQVDLEVFHHDPEMAIAGEAMQSSIETLNTVLLFKSSDLQSALGDRSRAFLDVFSFVPGTENLDVLIPSDDDIVRVRPFARIGDDQFCLLDVCYCSFAPSRRLLECFDTERKMQRLHKKRDDVLEHEAERLWTSTIRPDCVARNYYIPVGEAAQLAERDLLILKGDCLFVVESKARPLGTVHGRNDKLARIASDVKSTIQEGYNQACQVIHYIRTSRVPAPLYDSNKINRKVIAELDSTQIKTIIPVVFLDACYGAIATDLEPWLLLDKAVGYPWVIDRDMFETITLLLDDHDKLYDYLQWRLAFHGKFGNGDEAVIAGFFLHHGPAAPPAGADWIQLNDDYADVFEAAFFRKHGVPIEIPKIVRKRPVWSSMQRTGNTIDFEIGGKHTDSINIITGNSKSARPRPSQEPARHIGRNDTCPCGSGIKFKKCCIKKI